MLLSVLSHGGKPQLVQRSREIKAHANTQRCDNVLRRDAGTNIKAVKFILAAQSVSVLPWVAWN